MEPKDEGTTPRRDKALGTKGKAHKGQSPRTKGLSPEGTKPKDEGTEPKRDEAQGQTDRALGEPLGTSEFRNLGVNTITEFGTSESRNLAPGRVRQ